MVNKSTPGSGISSSAMVRRWMESIPASYTLRYDTIDGYYYAESDTIGCDDVSGTDPKTILDAVVSALPSGHGGIFVKNGTYTSTVGGTVDIPINKYVTIVGENRYKTILDGFAIWMKGAGSIDNLTVDYSGQTYYTSICLSNASGWKEIKNCNLIGGQGCLKLEYVGTGPGQHLTTSKVVVDNCDFTNTWASAYGSIIMEGGTGDIWIRNNRFWETTKPFIEMYSESSDYPCDNVWLIGNDFVGPQTSGDPMYPMSPYSTEGGTLHVVGNVWRPNPAYGLGGYRNPGIMLSGRYVEFVGNTMLGFEPDLAPGVTPTLLTFMRLAVKDALDVNIVGNLIFGGSFGVDTASYTAANLSNLNVKDNAFIRTSGCPIFLGNAGGDVTWTAKKIVIDGNDFVDWAWSEGQYPCIGLEARSAVYPATINNLLITNNTFYKETNGGHVGVAYAAFGNPWGAIANFDIDTLVFRGNNFFGVTYPFASLGSITPTSIMIKDNTNYEIEHHTASDTLELWESGTTHTNLSAGGNIKLTLPQDALAGITFDFAVMTAGQQLQIDPGAAGALYVNGAKQADDAYIWADDEGESVKLVCDGNHDWVALYTQGTWTVV